MSVLTWMVSVTSRPTKNAMAGLETLMACCVRLGSGCCRQEGEAVIVATEMARVRVLLAKEFEDILGVVF